MLGGKRFLFAVVAPSVCCHCARSLSSAFGVLLILGRVARLMRVLGKGSLVMAAFVGQNSCWEARRPEESPGKGLAKFTWLILVCVCDPRGTGCDICTDSRLKL